MKCFHINTLKYIYMFALLVLLKIYVSRSADLMREQLTVNVKDGSGTSSTSTSTSTSSAMTIPTKHYCRCSTLCYNMISYDV